MNTVTLHFKADNQQLTALDGLYKLASNTVEYVKAIFTLGENWAGFDVVRAAWYTDFECISTVLDGNGECFVPWEVLSRPEGVTINLYGCDLEEESDGEAVLVDRLTTYPVKAILVDVDARVCGSETKPVTPSQFEQYIAIVQELVGTVRDITSCVLNPDYTLTINYSDDTSDTVGPIRGEQGEQGPTGPAGNGISKIEKISTAGLVDTYRITFTNGTHKDYTVTNGAKGDTGNGIESIYLTGTSGAVKTYTILFTNGDTFEYQVTDGEVTRAELEAVLPTDTASGAIASFPDGCNLFPLKKCEVTLEPIQDLSHGDPSPSNICPISGRSSVGVTRAGKNFFDDESAAFNSSYWTRNGHEYTTSDSHATYVYNNVKLYAGKTYNLSVYLEQATNDSMKVQFRTSSGTIVAGNSTAYTTAGRYSVTYTPSATGEYRVLVGGNSSGTLKIKNIQLEESPTATDYSAYNATTTTIPLGQTVYGGTLDVVSGVLTVTHGIGNLENLDWSESTATRYVSSNVSDMKPVPNGNVLPSLYAEKYKVIKWNDGLASNHDGIAVANSNYAYFYLYKDENTPTPSGQFVYELATPTEIQLTPTQVACLLGQNNVWANCGDTSVTYKADVQRWVEKKLGA